MAGQTLPLVFVFGLYRSGTTLVSRLLNGDTRFASASDPIRPFFNAYTNFLRSQIGEDTCLFEPTNEGFKDNPEYYSTLLSSRFEEPIDYFTTDQVINQIISQTRSYSPVFSEFIQSNVSSFSPHSWNDILHYLIDSLSFCYAESNESALAVKEVWTLEAAYPLIQTFKDRVKIVVVLRDPADIFASSKAKAGNYPLLYLVRHWRKNIAIAQHLKSLYPSQVYLLKYEDLCNDPLSTYNTLISNILPNQCNFPVGMLPHPREDN